MLIPIAVLLAAGSVVSGPGEAPAAPAQTVVTPAGDTVIQTTNR